MKTVAAISDSIENSIYDPGRSVITIKDMQLDPVVMVSRVYDGDGEFESIDVSEIIDAAFSECDVAAVSVGYLTDDSVISYLAGKLSSGEHAPVVARPSMISDDGDILVDESVYHAFADHLMKHIKTVIVNSYEAELLSGFECVMESDYMRAAKKIHNTFGCHVIVTASEQTGGKLIACVGDKSSWMDLPQYAEGFEPHKYELSSAIACGYAHGFSSIESIEFALGFCTGNKKIEDLIGTPEPEDPVKAEKPAENISFVSPGKALRDIARGFNSEFKSTEDRPAPAVTSVIDENLNKPRGEVSGLTAPAKSVSDTVTELQALKERLEKLSGAAGNSGA